ncbi:MAG: hypothetical protein LE180_00465 [Endomicrobium sp.]|nr:hypothetical protein [Endomicrobium sp.]
MKCQALLNLRMDITVMLKISEQKLPTISFDEAKERIKRTLKKDRFDAWLTRK